MGDGKFQVDPGAIDGLASQLRGGARELEGSAKNVPDATDAGDSTALVADVMSGLMELAGGLVHGAEKTSDDVVASRGDYTATDQNAAGDFPQPH